MSSEERFQNELIAQRKRVAALKYLASQGQRVDSTLDVCKKSSTSTSQTDNTLELLRKERISSSSSCSAAINAVDEKSMKLRLLKQQEIVRSDLQKSVERDREHSNLPEGWDKLLDANSGLYYYWNKITNETTWERPANNVASIVAAPMAAIEIDTKTTKAESGPWRQQTHAATRQIYWINIETNEKTFEDPTTRSSAISSEAAEVIPEGKSGLVGSKQKADAVSDSRGNGKTKKLKKEDVDPLDPTGGKGNWAYGRFSEGKMADSTASGPLWQQRPYPAPGKALEGKSKPNARNIVGPVFISSSGSTNSSGR